MIRRYVYGNVIETEAVLNKPEQENGTLPYFTVDEQAMTLSYTMEEKDQIYGLGENVRGINKRDGTMRANAVMNRITKKTVIPCMVHTISW